MDNVYFILGCTACGKGALGRELARRLDTAVLSVDSMKVYRKMDIGTAKPSAEVLAEIPHYGIDVVDPWDSYSVAEYITHADKAVAEIRRQGKVPLAVGGTSLYIKAMCEGLFEGPSAQPEIRAELQARAAAESPQALHRELAAVDPASAERIHPNDEKRIIRALEVFRATGQPLSELQTQWESNRPRINAVRIGIRREKELQSRRINARVKKMVEMGLLDEVRGLHEDPRGLSPQAAQAVGYAEIIEHLRGKCSFDKAVEQVKINTRRLAKKQRTWQRRWMDVIWFDITDDDTTESVADRVMKQITFE